MNLRNFKENTKQYLLYKKIYENQDLDFVKTKIKKYSKFNKKWHMIEVFKMLNTFDGISIQFLMDEYGSYVDKGVKGKGGVIKSGEYKGNWGGRRWYTTWKGRRKDSPFKFGMLRFSACLKSLV